MLCITVADEKTSQIICLNIKIAKYLNKKDDFHFCIIQEKEKKIRKKGGVSKFIIFSKKDINLTIHKIVKMLTFLFNKTNLIEYLNNNRKKKD